MSVTNCSTCGALTFDGGKTLMGYDHTCPPKWKLWVPEEGETEEDADEGYGIDAEDAAETYVEKRYGDGESFRWLERDGALVHVRGDDGSLTKVRVHAEATVRYNASTEEDAP